MLFSITLSFGLLAIASADQIWRPSYPAYSAPDGRSTCTVRALGNQQDDSPNILRAFQDCGNNGHIIFPAGEKYTVASVINVQLNNVVIDWMGEWQLAPNKSYWANNSIPIAFQVRLEVFREMISSSLQPRTMSLASSLAAKTFRSTAGAWAASMAPETTGTL